MSITIDYDTSIDSLVLKADGIVEAEAVLALRDGILHHPKFRTNINQLFDTTEGGFDLTTDDLKKIALHYQGKTEILGNNRKLALVVSRELDFGRMRQYEVYFDAGPDVLVQSFRSMSEARAWIAQ